MIKTVPFDIIANFLIGMVVAIACAGTVRSADSIIVNRLVLGLVLFELFFFLPLGAYLYFFYPDWSLMFFVDPANWEPATVKAVGAAALACYMAAIVAGYAIAARLIRADNTGSAIIVAVALAAALGLFSLITIRQLTQVGAYADWAAMPRTTVPIYAHRIGYVVTIYAVAAGIALLMLIRNMAGQQRELS